MTPKERWRRIENLAREFHEVYQREAKRQGDVRHKDNYDELPENIKEFDRALARYVLDAGYVKFKSTDLMSVKIDGDKVIITITPNPKEF